MFKLFSKKNTKESTKKNTNNEKHIQEVMGKTGWTYEVAVERMKAAKEKVGISYRDYNKYDFHKFSEGEQEEGYKKTLEEKERRRLQKENDIQEVMEKNNWTYEYAVEQMKKAKNKVGISYRDYNEYDFYKFSEEEQEEGYKKVLKKKENRKQQREHCILYTMDETGWDYEYAVEQIKDSKERLGITYSEYEKAKLFNVAKEEQEKAYSEYKKKQKKAAKRENHEEYLKIVMERTGWDRDYANAKIEDTSKRTGCTTKEYVMYKLYERTDEEQETFYLAGHQHTLHVKYAASKEFVQLIRDKEMTNNFFSEYVRRPWCVNKKVSFEEFCTVFKDSSRVIYKPVGGHCGYGVEAFDLKAENLSDVYEKLASLPTGVVEEYINQHAEMKKLCPSSVNSLRFVTISSDTVPVGQEGKRLDVVYSIVRIGRGDSIVDNLHSGGMVANVNLETGVLETHGADHRNNVYITHPDTGTVIKGFKVPYFKEALEMVKEAIETKNVEGYLGWDIAIGENGPMLLEVNNRPGADGLQTAHAQEGRGMKHVMQKYM